MSEEVAQQSENIENNSEQTTEQSTEQTTEETQVSYVDGKFKSVGALEDSYKELQKMTSKKLGAFQGAPEDGYQLEEGIEVSDTIQNWAKENQFSNEALNSLVKTYQEDMAIQQEAYVANEMKALGEHAVTRVKNAGDWAKANLGEHAEALNLMGAGAKGIEAIEKIMELTKTQAPADIKSAPSIDEDKLNFMQFEERDAHGNRKYVTDPKFRAKVLAMREQLFQN